jgi:hypothetical protein
MSDPGGETSAEGAELSAGAERSAGHEKRIIRSNGKGARRLFSRWSYPAVRIVGIAAFRSCSPVFSFEPTLLHGIVEYLAIAEPSLPHQDMENIKKLVFFEASIEQDRA